MGYRKIHLYLKREGVKISKPTTHKYMKELSLKSITVKKKPKSISKEKPFQRFENVLKQDFHAARANTKWCSDITYLKLTNGRFAYACTILDLYDKSVVGFQISDHMTSQLAIDTLSDALAKHHPPKGLLFHTDQGVQYTAKTFVEFCQRHEIRQSMSRVGTPYDNAVMESFFGKFKREHMNHFSLKNVEHTKSIAEDYIYLYYNSIRPHSSLEGLTPWEKRYAG